MEVKKKKPKKCVLFWKGSNYSDEQPASGDHLGTSSYYCISVAWGPSELWMCDCALNSTAVDLLAPATKRPTNLLPVPV